MESKHFFFSFILWIAKNYKQKSVIHKLPPGPWKLPVIGNLHQLVAVSSSLPPHHALHKLSQKYGPLMHLQLGEISAVVVSCPEIAKEFMKTHDVAFSQRPQFLSSEIMAYGSIDIAFAPYGDYWRQMRKICMLELLSAKQVQSFSHIREHEVENLIQSIHSSSGSPINLSSRFLKMISTFVSRAAFSKISKDQEEFLLLVKKAIELSDGFDLADLFPSVKPIHLVTGLKAELLKIHRKVDKILEDIIAENQEKLRTREEDEGEAKKENLIEVLLRVKQSSNFDIPVTMNSIKAVIWVSTYLLGRIH